MLQPIHPRADGHEQSLDLDALGQIEGWLCDAARDLSLRLIAHQKVMGWQTAGLEFGVHKGRFLALLAATHPLTIGVDALLDADGVPLNQEDRRSALAVIERNVGTVTSTRPRMFGSYTRDLSADALLRLSPQGFSFIHIDGGHEAEDVTCDLGLAQRLLSAQGIVAVDDVFNAGTPGVAEGFFTFLGGNRGFTVLAICGNKVFLVRDTRAYAEQVPGTIVRLFGGPVSVI